MRHTRSNWSYTLSFLLLIGAALPVRAGELVTGIRNKLAAGDLPSGMAAAEDYKRKNGVDAEYLDAIGWLARGAETLKRPDLAARYKGLVRLYAPTRLPEADLSRHIEAVLRETP